MKDAAGGAVDDAIGEGPGPPERDGCALASPRQNRAQHRERQHPGELAGEHRPGEAQRPHRHRIIELDGRSDGGTRCRRSDGAVAHKPLQAVVHDDQLEHGIVFAAAGVGPVVGRREIEGDRPGKTDDRQRRHTRGQPAQMPAPVEGRHREVGREQGRAADEGRQHLHVEGQAQQRHRPDEGRPAPAHRQGRRQQQDEDQPGIGVVGTIDGDGDGGDGEEEGRDQAGRRAERLAHEAIQDRHRGHPGQCLRQVDRPSAEAQECGEERLDPEGERRLVEGHEARRIEGVVEEQPPALQHAAHARGVVFGAEAIVLEPPQPQDGGEHEHAAQSQSLQLLSAQKFHGLSGVPPAGVYASRARFIPRQDGIGPLKTKNAPAQMKAKPTR